MILFDFATPTERDRVKVMLRPQESPLFSPTRHGAVFSPKFDADEPVRRQRFSRGIPQGDALDGADDDTDVALLEPDAPVEDALSDNARDAQGATHPEVSADEAALEPDASAAAEPEGQEAIHAAAETAQGEPQVTEDSLEAAAHTNDAASDVQVEEGIADDTALLPDAGAIESEVLQGSEAADPADPADPLDLSESAGPVEPSALQASTESENPLDASAEELVKQAFEAGYAAAKAESGDASGEPNPEAEDASYLRGLEEGQRQAKDELEAEVLLAADDLKALANQLAQAARDTETFYQPLLKLSMHLAEQLVRGELSLSGQAVTRLVERCLSEFQQETSAPIVVRMNPADHERHLAYGAMAPKNMDLRPDPSLSAGSVKVSMNGAMIEDLIEHRRQALWDALMSAAATPDDDLPDSFLRNVAIVKEAMASVDDEGAQPPAL